MRWRSLLLLTLLVAPASAPADSYPAAPAGRRVLKVYKAERRMELLVRGEVVRRFQVGLGSAPWGDKRRQGDQRTPEGEFYVAWKNRNSSFHRFLGLSYPMERHAERAFTSGQIDEGTYQRIVRATRDRRMPPQDTVLGGYVGIHGGGGSADWTLGCIAVSDEEAEWLFHQMRHGDKIEVLP